MFARLMTTQIRQLRDYLRQFCRRVESDQAALSETFGGAESVGPVVDLDILADDTHGDGQAVMRVTFESDRSIVYKPRSVEAGDRFYRLLDDLNDHLPVPDFWTPTYLCRDGYGWMEWIAVGDLDDRAALDRYYRRAGALCCLTYLLEFTDCQVENLLVAGEQPIIVDAETVLHPYITPDRYLGGEIETTDAFMNSALLSHLLPFSSIGTDHDHENNLSVKAAGFAVTDEPATFSDVHLPKIVATNSDVMAVENETATLERAENVPVLDGEPQPPSQHLDTFLDGFEATYRRLLTMREEGVLTDDLNAFGRFEGVVNRMIFRPTLQYMASITALSARECLHDSVQFSLTLEQLAVPFFEDRIVDDESWQMYEAEREALRLLDPPRFTSETDSRTLRKDGDPVGVEATQSGIERAQQRLAAASLVDMEEQVELVRGCFGEIPSPQTDVNPDTGGGMPTDEDLRREAVDIVDGIREAGVKSQGTFACASLEGWLESDQLTLRALDESLQAGRAGIGVVGAALYWITGDRTYRRFALDTVRPLREAVQSGDLPSRMRATGGTRGAGSVAYGLGLVGDLLNEEDIVEEAARVGEFVTPAIIADDDRYDVVRGSAGTILGLLGIYERRREPALLAAAKRCGDHLLDRRDHTDDGIPCWHTIDGQPPLTGFAHGVAGISYALVRLSDATGDPTYRRVAMAALEHEADTYVPAANNWRDLRAEANGGFADRWCHGRSGIGLARIGMSDYANHELIDQGIERALAGATTNTEDRLDHLCCGDAGRAMFLLEAKRWDNGRADDARALLGRILERKETTGSYWTKSRTNRFQKPTFFDGAAGVAYAMLRVTAPKTLPCVLRFE